MVVVGAGAGGPMELVARVLNAAQVALPHLREAAETILPGTPVTFERFARRVNGWVGGIRVASTI